MTSIEQYRGTDMMNNQSFAEKLVSEIPALAPLLAEHKSDNEELLPHVFFGDVTRYVSDLHKDSLKGNRNAEETLRKILSALEAGMASGVEDVQELISVSFLENLDSEDADFQELKRLFGPKLVDELKNLEGGIS